MDSIYEKYEERIVRMGRNLITLCEKNELYPKDDTMWNAAVTAGNKLVTIGMTYSRFKDTSDLNHNEKNPDQYILFTKCSISHRMIHSIS